MLMSADGKKNLMLRRFVFYTVVLLLLISIGAVYLSARSKKKNPNELLLHGWVEGTRVTLSSKVAGPIIALPVEEGDQIKTGQRIAEIKSDQIRAQLANADAEISKHREQFQRAAEEISVVESSLEGARIGVKLAVGRSTADIGRAEAALAAAQSRLVEAEAKASRAEKDMDRFRPLVASKVISQNMFDSVEEEYKSKKAAMEAASREVSLASANLDMAKTTKTETLLKQNDVATLQRQLAMAKTMKAIAAAGVESAAAKRAEIQATFEDCVLNSPLTGTVIDKAAEMGEHVMPGSPIAVLIDLNQLYVKTYIEQTEVSKVRLGDSAKISVDSFPNRTFDGTIYYISSQAEFTPRDVQMDEYRSRMVYMAKVSVHNPDGLVKPGVPADVTLILNTAKPGTPADAKVGTSAK
jgi:HlyD family secretion protein